LLKYIKIGSILIVILSIFNGCKVDKEKVSNNKKIKKPELFYFLNKNTNNINKYPNLDKYNIIVIDLFDTTKKEIEDLKNKNKEVFCYFSAGSYENWREDKNKFNKEDLGNELEGWNGENWLDIRNKNIYSIMKDRLDIAKNKGCNGVDLDNIDGYTNETGFNLSYKDQLKYNKKIAEYAKLIGLKTILKNDLSQLNDLKNYYDYAVNESCHEYNECNLYKNWLQNKKYVFNIEYSKRNNLYKNEYFKTYLANQDLDGKFYKKIN